MYKISLTGLYFLQIWQALLLDYSCLGLNKFPLDSFDTKWLLELNNNIHMYFPRALSVLTQAFFWTIRWFLDLISAKLASIWTEMHKFATRQLAFLATSIAFQDILTWTYAKIEILRAARCSGRKFCSEFFTQPFEHFCAYLRLYLEKSL